MAHAMIHRAEIASCATEQGKATFSVIVLLWMLAQDSYATKRNPSFGPKMPDHAHKTDSGFLAQFKFYDAQDFWFCADFSKLVVEHELGRAQRFFEGSGSWVSFGVHFVSPEGQKKLKADWPSIWDELNLEAHSNLES
jgi:hypothetical protein